MTAAKHNRWVDYMIVSLGKMFNVRVQGLSSGVKGIVHTCLEVFLRKIQKIHLGESEN
jgi:hypothetical protein